VHIPELIDRRRSENQAKRSDVLGKAVEDVITPDVGDTAVDSDQNASCIVSVAYGEGKEDKI
jgi:hypothetical protein